MAAMFGLLLPSFIASVLLDTESGATSFLIGADLFVLILFALSGFAFVSTVFAFIPSKEKSKSPMLMSAIGEAVSFVWFPYVFLVFSSVLSTNANSGDGSASGLGLAIGIVLLAVLGIVFIIAVNAFMFVPIKLHAITYSIRNIRNGTFESKAIVIAGTILLFLIPVIGQVLICIYEGQLEKRADIVENQ